MHTFINITLKFLYVLAVGLSPFFTAWFVWWLYWRYFEKLKPIPNEKGKFKQHGFLRRLFIDFPKQWAYDRITIDPNTFDPPPVK